MIFNLLSRKGSGRLLTQLTTAMRYKKILLSPVFAGRKPLIKLEAGAVANKVPSNSLILPIPNPKYWQQT